MADIEKKPANEDAAHKAVPTREQKTVVEKTDVMMRRHPQRWILSVVLLVIAIYLVLMMIGFWAFRMWADHSEPIFNGTNSSYGNRMLQGRSGFSDERTIITSQTSSDGLTTTTTNATYTQTQGVVTAVNSDTIVIAGGGKTQTIKTNSSTTYVGGIKPVVNDTVVVTGTKDGDTITATQIAVYN